MMLLITHKKKKMAKQRETETIFSNSFIAILELISLVYGLFLFRVGVFKSDVSWWLRIVCSQIKLACVAGVSLTPKTPFPFIQQLLSPSS